MKKSMGGAWFILILAILAPWTNRAGSLVEFEQRAAWYLAHAPEDWEGSAGAVVRLVKGKDISAESLEAERKVVLARANSMIDFSMVGIIRLLYLDRDAARLSPEIRSGLSDTLLRSKYWIDEPGTDDLCFWSENHQIAYHSDEYLAGALLPDQVFANSGMTGREHMEKGRRLALRWMDWRARFGFSEWLSNVYISFDLIPLLNLVDFAPDPEVRARAAMLVDMLALNMALNSYRGYFISTHGRTYLNDVLQSDGAAGLFYLWWGERPPPGFSRDKVDRGAVSLSTSTYRLPAAIYQIGRDRSVMENYQTNGLSMEDGPAHGLAHEDMEAGMFYWGQGMYTHHAIADTTARMWKEYGLYENKFFRGFAKASDWLSRMGLFDDFLEHGNIASSAAFLAESRTCTYRTADYILSSVQDHRKGELDAQNFAWIAGFSPRALVFTNHPGRVFSSPNPNHWIGNGANPRVAQRRNVALVVYNPPLRTALGEGARVTFTHAYFPRDAFDEVRSQGGWHFGRVGEGFIALLSQKPSRWIEQGEWAGREIRAPGLANIWVCEMGRKEDWKSFEAFVEAVLRARIEFGKNHVVYHSPSLGAIEFGWDGPLKVRGEEIPLMREMRYDNPYVTSPRFSRRIEVKHGEAGLILDFGTGERIVR